MVGGGLPEEATFERRPEGGEGRATGALGQGDSLCKGPEAGMFLEYLGNSQIAIMAAAESMKGRVGMGGRALWATARTLALALSELGAIEGSKQKRDVTQLRYSQAPSGC